VSGNEPGSPEIKETDWNYRTDNVVTGVRYFLVGQLIAKKIVK